MPKLFGYLNQNNPMTIGDADAQIMYNCSIEHGWIEHKDYPVYDSYKLAVPNRYVKLPNGDEVFIKPANQSKYGASGILYGNIAVPDIYMKASQDGRTVFNLRSCYVPSGSVPNIRMFVNGTENTAFTVSLSKTTYGYPVVTYTGSRTLVSDDSIEFKLDRSITREVTIGSSQKRASELKFEDIALPIVDKLYKILLNGNQSLVLDSYTTFCNLYIAGVWQKYKSDTKHKFRNIRAEIIYYNGTQRIVKPLADNEYSIVPHTYVDGSESGSISVFFTKPVEGIAGWTQPYDITLHLTADYYQNLNRDDFVIENAGYTKPIEFFYAATVTKYNTESAPAYKTIQVGGDGGYDLYQIKLAPVWRTDGTDNYVYDGVSVYRIPTGGDEYLLVKYFDINDPNYSAAFTDDILFFNQSDILDTNGNTSILFYNSDINSIILHKDMLFVSYGKLLYYSDVGDYFKFNAKSFLAFPDNVVDIIKHYSYLMVFTEKECYVLSGDDGNTFSVDNIDYRVDTDYDSNGNEETFTVGSVSYKKASTIYNCAQSVYNKVITLVKNHKSFSGRTSVMLVNTRYAYDMTNKVRKFMDYMLPSSSNQDALVDNVNRNRKLENKYYIVELKRISSSGVEKISLVYDALADGFILYKADAKDSQGNGYFVENNQNIYFKYRTKEFKTSYLVTPQAQYIKGIYVKGCGDFTVNIYGDGEIVSSVTYREPSGADRTALKIIINNVSNKRFSTLSMEFIGLSADAQIHDWEVYH